MTHYPRYAIYFVPPADSPLYRFGADLLGYDSFRATDCDFPADLLQQHDDWRDLTKDPRKYGFHATLKAPFPLRLGKSEIELFQACRTFADITRPVPRIVTMVNALGDFVAVVPSEPNAALNQLANDCVIAFEPFRAPMTTDDRARRNPERLTTQQAQQLDQWGYPYVFNDFRFHMTLTGRIAAERRPGILNSLRTRYAMLQMTSQTIGEIALCRQDSKDSRFTVVETFPIKETS
jgi:putative phosphonate metabolism protein